MSWVAVLAAYVLVLQALLGGIAAGAHANARILDHALALSLCAPGSEPVPVTDTGAAGAHADLSCCTAGCPMIGAAGPANPDYALLTHRPADFVAFSLRLDRPVGYLADHSSGRPRAPPALI